MGGRTSEDILLADHLLDVPRELGVAHSRLAYDIESHLGFRSNWKEEEKKTDRKCRV
jgi:hypothetical protein